MYKLLSLLFLFGTLVAAQDGAVDSELCACTALWDPVCGRDGETYRNRGCADCAGVELACSKECPCNSIVCTCLAGGPEVCGIDEVTYANECFAGCEGIPVACEGKCPCKTDPGCFCIQIYDPVCGVDGKTYGNDCEAGCAGVVVDCKGECPCEFGGCVCPEYYSPVCGVDNVKYDNECFAGCADMPIDCHGECPCPCNEGRVACLVDPCQNAECPAYPDAKCFANYCGGCNAVFVFNGMVVDCGLPSFPPSCVEKDGRCNAYATQFPDSFPNAPRCCAGLTCCPKCSERSGEQISVTSVSGTCKYVCPC